LIFTGIGEPTPLSLTPAAFGAMPAAPDNGRLVARHRRRHGGCPAQRDDHQVPGARITQDNAE
jgi:hypothetical protein